MAPLDTAVSPEQLLGTLRGLVKDVHESTGDPANTAIAAVHIFHILDAMLSNGHPVPLAWEGPDVREKRRTDEALAALRAKLNGNAKWSDEPYAINRLT